jgi:hypothetical protein
MQLHFDIRVPIGSMFALLGALLVAYAVVGQPRNAAVIDARTLDGAWGAVMLVFGAAMLLLARRHRHRRATA